MAVDALRLDDKIEGDALLADYVQRYRSLVERLCRILLGDASEAEDAAQQTFLLAYQSLLGGTRPHNPRAWLCTIARRECWARDHRRRRERAVPPEEARAEPDPAERTVLRAELATINAGLEQLPTRQRQAIVLRELAGLSYTQLAAALEVSESAAEALLVRARRNLREVRLLLFLIPFPRSLRRLFRHGSGRARSAVGVPAAKAVAVATIVTATVAVAGSGVPAERAVEPTPIVAERPVPMPRPVARAPHRRVPVPRPAVRHAPPPAAVGSTKTAVAPAHTATTQPATAGQTMTSDPGPSPAVSSPPAAPHAPARTSTPTPTPQTQRPRPSAPRPHAPAPKHTKAPPVAPATTPSPPPPTDTEPVAPPPPPPDATATTPSVPEDPSGGTSGSDGDAKPGNGYGDENHDHSGKR